MCTYCHTEVVLRHDCDVDATALYSTLSGAIFCPPVTLYYINTMRVSNPCYPWARP